MTPDPTPEAASIGVAFATVTAEEISLAACSDAVESSHAGALVTFEGIVRDHDEGRGVSRLAYTAHPSAGTVIMEVAREIAAAHPLVRIAAAHRIGELGIGDVALACAVASAHRREAFAACAELVDAIKERVPIWKEQGFSDGSTEWVAALG